MQTACSYFLIKETGVSLAKFPIVYISLISKIVGKLVMVNKMRRKKIKVHFHFGG